MFVCGHLGVGRAIARPWTRGLPLLPFFVGALLPDLIDKPLYYLHLSPFISCTRTFAHTGLFAAAVLGAGLLTRSKGTLALAAGVATHLLLDCAMDVFAGSTRSGVVALLWPFYSGHFVFHEFRTPLDHLAQVFTPQTVVTELLGLALLVWEGRRFLQRRTSSGSRRPAA